MEDLGKDARLFGQDFILYKNALDLLFQRHLIINSNIANQNTPRYKSKDLSFEPYLKSIIEENKVRGRKIELSRTHPTHLPSPYPPPPKPTVFYETTAFGPDGNSVDIDNEMIKLSENALRYRATTQFVSSKFEEIKSTLERMRP
jgi:flagellar basal-body rod protein FlgB